jgi:putative transposase
VKGRKRFLLTDTQGWLIGLLIGLWVDSADTQDRDGGRIVMAQAKRRHPRLRHLWVDGAFGGEFADWVRECLGISIDVVGKLAGQVGFHVLPRRWVAERAFGWWNKQRRLSKDYEELEESTEAWIYLTMIGIMARRLAHIKR